MCAEATLERRRCRGGLGLGRERRGAVNDGQCGLFFVHQALTQGIELSITVNDHGAGAEGHDPFAALRINCQPVLA